MIWWWTANFEPQLNEMLSSSGGFKEGNATPLQSSCLENPMDGGDWWVAVHGVARDRHSWVTSLSLFTFMHWRRKWQPTPVFLPGESQNREVWWAAVFGVAQSRTRLKQLSSSSSSWTCLNQSSASASGNSMTLPASWLFWCWLTLWLLGFLV